MCLFGCCKALTGAEECQAALSGAFCIQVEDSCAVTVVTNGSANCKEKFEEKIRSPEGRPGPGAVRYQLIAGNADGNHLLDLAKRDNILPGLKQVST
jgi:hypothetical protein